MRLDSMSRIAWRNLWRNPKRTAFALAAIAASQFALLAMSGVMNGYRDGAFAAITGPMLGHVQVHAPDWLDTRAIDKTVSRSDEVVADLRKQPGVTRVSARIYAPALAALTRDASSVMVLGLDPVEESKPQGLLEALPPSMQLGPHHVLLGTLLAQQMGVKTGDSIVLVGQGADGSLANDKYEVAGTVSTSVDSLNRLGVLMTLADARELLVMPDQVHEVVVYSTDPEGAGGLAAGLRGLPALAGLEVLPWREVVPGLVSFFDLTKMAGLIVLVLVFLSSTAGIANTLMMATFERTHEFGMLLALGCRPARIVRMVVTETLLLGLLGVFIGSVFGLALVVVTRYTGINIGAMASASQVNISGLNVSLIVTPRLEVFDVVKGILAVLITSVVVAALPATHASRLEPVEALRS